jgi:hypothetical protein
MRVIAVICEYETIKKMEHLGLWNIRSHSPPPLPNMHPPPVGDAMPDMESYFQDFIPSDDQNNSAGQPNWTAVF